MYIPPFNKFESQHEAIAFMQRYSFATIVTVKDGLPVATQLPFLVEEKDGLVTLRSHFAKANPQAAESIDTRVLVIFTEPHAYISPKHYEKVESVPTWNYLAVHAYGKFKLLEGEEHKAALLKATIQNFEAGYLKQWESLPDNYKQNMMKGITAFEIVVQDLQAKAKLSQNRSDTERKNIIDELDHSENTSEKDLAEYMASLNKLP